MKKYTFRSLDQNMNFLKMYAHTHTSYLEIIRKHSDTFTGK